MTDQGQVLLVDDEAMVREATAQWLELSGFRVECFSRAEQALERIAPFCPGILLTDVRMPGMDGLELMTETLKRAPDLPVILLTAHGDVDMATAAMREGAYDFIEKPFVPERLVERIRRACEKRRLTLENLRLQQSLASRSGLEAPMSEAQAMGLLEQVPADFKGQLLEQAMAPEKLAMILLAAHMIIFWLSQDSNVTPPVCLTAFAAAAIARTPPMATGFTAWKISKGLYVVPLLFAYTPFIGGSWTEVLTIFAFGILGMYAFVGFMEGYLEGRLNLLLRLVSGFCAIGLLWPHGQLAYDLVAAVAFVALFLFSRRFSEAVVAGGEEHARHA